MHPLMHLSKTLMRPIIRAIGFDIIRHEPTQITRSIEDDIAKLIGVEAPVVFDVGSNCGQSMLAFRRSLPNSKIHCFEPGKLTFNELTNSAKSLNDITLNNCAIGNVSDVVEFYEYDQSVMNSLHKPDVQNWSQPTSSYQVDVLSIDDYCRHSGISRIDLLKVDTQGHDMEVIQGAAEMIKAGSVRLIMCEVIFANLYEDQPSPYEFLDLLSQNGYKLVSFYNLCYHYGVLGWCDVLFIHSSALASGPSAE